MKAAPMLALSIFSLLLSFDQVQKMEPDSPKFMNGEVTDASAKVFAVDSWEKGPIGILAVEEVKQQNPPSLWAVTVRNRGSNPVTYRMAASVVTGDNKIKGSQLLQTIKNLQPGKDSRQQIKIYPTILNPSDRVVFYLSEVTAGSDPFKSDKTTVDQLITSVAARHPMK